MSVTSYPSLLNIASLGCVYNNSQNIFHVRFQSDHIKIQLQYKVYHSFTVFKNDRPALKKQNKNQKKDCYTQNIRKQLNKQVWHFHNFIV